MIVSLLLAKLARVLKRRQAARLPGAM